MHVHVPFSMQDITQCKEQLGSYSENPKKFKDEFERLSLNFSLTWRDIMGILTRCCNDEEKAQILDQARKMADERQRVDVRLALAEEAIPSTEPDWDPYKGRKGILKTPHYLPTTGNDPGFAKGC